MTRLPNPGGDRNQWGDILNDYLRVAHNNDGTLKNTGILADKYTKPSTGIPKTDLAASVQASLDAADAASAGTAPDATTTTRGVIRLAGDLTGDANAPLVAPNRILGSAAGASSHIQAQTITNANIHASAAITKSKLAPLAITNDDIAVGAAIVQSKIQGLTADLAGKAAIAHTHAIADIINLQTALDGKAAAGHTHTIANVTNLQATLDNKANSSHTHTIADTTGLQTALDGKAASGHTHTASQITNFTAAAAAVIGDRVQAGSNVTVDYDAGTGITTINSTATGGGGTPSDSVTTVAGRTGDVVLGAGDIVSGTFTTNRIPDLDASKITSGTLAIGRIPTGTTGTTVALGNHTHAGYAAAIHQHTIGNVTNLQDELDSKANTTHTHTANQITAGTFDIARIPTGTTGTTVALGNHTHTASQITDFTAAAAAVHHDDRYYTETEVDTRLTNKLNTSEKGQPSGLATLDADGKLPANQLPALAIKDTFTVASQAAMLTLNAQRGDMAIRTDNGRTYVLAGDNAGTLGDWQELIAHTGTAPVTSVAGKTGVVTLVKADVGLGNVDNTSDANKPVSAATQTALEGKAGIFWRTWDGSAWSVRPATPTGVPVTAYSTHDINAPQPTGAQVGDIWERHPQAVA